MAKPGDRNPNPLGVPVSDLHEIFSFADLDGDGVVDWDEIVALLSDPEIEALLVVSSAYGNTDQADAQYKLAMQWLYDRFTKAVSWDDFCNAFGPAQPESAGDSDQGDTVVVRCSGGPDSDIQVEAVATLEGESPDRDRTVWSYQANDSSPEPVLQESPLRASPEDPDCELVKVDHETIRADSKQGSPKVYHVTYKVWSNKEGQQLASVDGGTCADLDRAFGLIDTNKDGVIDREEFHAARMRGVLHATEWHEKLAAQARQQPECAPPEDGVPLIDYVDASAAALLEGGGKDETGLPGHSSPEEGSGSGGRGERSDQDLYRDYVREAAAGGLGMVPGSDHGQAGAGSGNTGSRSASPTKHGAGSGNTGSPIRSAVPSSPSVNARGKRPTRPTSTPERQPGFESSGSSEHLRRCPKPQEIQELYQHVLGCEHCSELYARSPSRSPSQGDSLPRAWPLSPAVHAAQRSPGQHTGLADSQATEVLDQEALEGSAIEWLARIQELVKELPPDTPERAPEPAPEPSASDYTVQHLHGWTTLWQAGVVPWGSPPPPLAAIPKSPSKMARIPYQGAPTRVSENKQRRANPVVGREPRVPEPQRSKMRGAASPLIPGSQIRASAGRGFSLSMRQRLRTKPKVPRR